MITEKKRARIPRFAAALFALVPIVFSGASTTACQAPDDEAESSAEALTVDQEIDAATSRLGMFNATTAHLEETDLPAQATRLAWQAIADSVAGESRAEKIANVARAVRSAVDFVEKAEGLTKGELDAASFNAFVRDLVAQGTGIKPVDTIMKNWPAGTDFAALVRSATSGGGQLSIGTVLEYVRFFARNVEGSTLERRIKVVQTLLDIKTDAERRFAPAAGAGLNDAQVDALLAAAELLAGSDGFINKGDAPRLLPVVPKVVEQIADQLIREGLAQGLGELRAQHPFIYRRWARRPGGPIGRRVNAVIASNLSRARAQKYQAMQQAASASQEAWDAGMAQLGVHRYGLEGAGPNAYWDTARSLTTADVDRVVKAITGKSLDAQINLSNAAALKNGAIEARLGKLADVKAIMSRVELPDGIPVRDALAIVKARRAGQETPLPWGLSFRMTTGDKVMIRAYREPCECRFDANARRCVLEYTAPGTSSRASVGKPSASGAASCQLEQDCNAMFTDATSSTYLPYACGYRFFHRDSGAMSFYKHPSEVEVLNEDPDERFEGE